LFTGALAIAFMGERPGPYVWAGTVLITAGCAAISYKKKQDKSWNPRHLWMPAVSLMGFAVSNVFRKLGLMSVPSPLLGITVTSVVGLAFLAGLSHLLPRGQRPDLRPGKAWVFYGVCGLINTLSFFLHFFALLYGDLTIVTPLSSISPLFALFFSWLFLRDVERVTGWIVAGTLLIILGVALIAWRML
ncbi:MAG: EamA family transporter, partial [Nitrospinota bacterium]